MSTFYHYLQRKIINQSLGTVRKGKTTNDNLVFEKKILNDKKQCAKHIMLLTWGRMMLEMFILNLIWLVFLFSCLMNLSILVLWWYRHYPAFRTTDFPIATHFDIYVHIKTWIREMNGLLRLAVTLMTSKKVREQSCCSCVCQ